MSGGPVRDLDLVLDRARRLLLRRALVGVAVVAFAATGLAFAGDAARSALHPDPRPSPPAPPAPALAPVEGVHAEAHAASTTAPFVVVSWERSVDRNVVEYVVYRDGVRRSSVPAGQETYRDGGVSRGATYDYDVEARNADGRASPRSAPARVTVEARRDAVRPTAPRGLEIAVHTASADRTTRTFVRATWERATDNVGVTAYRVFRDGRLLAAVEATSGLVFVEDVTGLDTRQEHAYTVRAVDAAGNESAPSNEALYSKPVD